MRNADEDMLDDFLNNNINRNTDAFKEKLKSLKITVFSNCDIPAQRIEQLGKIFGTIEEVIEETDEETEEEANYEYDMEEKGAEADLPD